MGRLVGLDGSGCGCGCGGNANGECNEDARLRAHFVAANARLLPPLLERSDSVVHFYVAVE